jgi:hypothetical protein
MDNVTNYSLLVFVLSFITLWFSSWIGRYFLSKKYQLDEESREHLSVILAATLTLLGLIIGFSFSMATSRYDTRKNNEEAEANAIGTEFLRADLLPKADAARIRMLLRSYLEQRILFHDTPDGPELLRINYRISQLQTELWSIVLVPATTQPTPIVALAVSGMNDVFNSQGYTQAGLWNRIPIAAWVFMATIAIGCNLLVGYGSRIKSARSILLPFLPLIVSIAFMLIAEIDTPRHGIIRVKPLNLISLAESLPVNKKD